MGQGKEDVRGRDGKDNLKEDLEEMGQTIVEACRLAASDRDEWMNSVLRLSESGYPSPRH